MDNLVLWTTHDTAAPVGSGVRQIVTKERDWLGREALLNQTSQWHRHALEGRRAFTRSMHPVVRICRFRIGVSIKRVAQVIVRVSFAFDEKYNE